MKIEELSSPLINQNGYHKNTLTKERIGALFIYPIDYTPDDCLSCDGYLLDILDYLDLYKVIGTKFNQEGDEAGKFRIPDYNVTGKFLQPGENVGNKVDAGLPNITGGVYINGGDLNGAYGAFANDITRGNRHTANTWVNNISGVSINASRSSPLFGKSSTVQPSSQIVHICIKYK